MSEGAVRFFRECNISAHELIEKARANKPGRIHVVGIRRSEEKMIFEAIDAAGFIFHESAQSQAVRKLLRVIFDSPSITTTEDYEQQEEFSGEQIAEFLDFLEKTLIAREKTVLSVRYGLGGEKPKTFQEIGDHYTFTTRSRAQKIHDKVIQKLRCRQNAVSITYIFPNFSEFSEPMKIVCEPRKYSHVVDQIPIDHLLLTTRLFNCLKRAGYEYVSELLPLTEVDLIGIRNLGHKGAEEIINVVNEFRTPKSKSTPTSYGTAISAGTWRFLQTVFSCEIDHANQTCSDEQISLVLRLLNDLLTPVEEMTVKARFEFKSAEPLTKEQVEVLLGSRYDKYAEKHALAKFRQPEILQKLAQAFPEFSEFLDEDSE